MNASVPLVEADAASQQDLDAATAALKANEANVKALKANVDQTSLVHAVPRSMRCREKWNR